MAEGKDVKPGNGIALSLSTLLDARCDSGPAHPTLLRTPPAEPTVWFSLSTHK